MEGMWGGRTRVTAIQLHEQYRHGPIFVCLLLIQRTGLYRCKVVAVNSSVRVSQKGEFLGGLLRRRGGGLELVTILQTVGDLATSKTAVVL